MRKVLPAAYTINVVLNWVDELKAGVPGGVESWVVGRFVWCETAAAHDLALLTLAARRSICACIWETRVSCVSSWRYTSSKWVMIVSNIASF